MHDLGEDSFHIYHKEYYIGSASLKTLPLDLEPPLQGKEYIPPYSNVIAKKKTNVFPSEITYRLVIRLLGFLECKLTKKAKYSKLNLPNSGTLKGSTFSGYRYSTNMAILRQSALANEKLLAYLFLFLCTVLPMIHEVSPGFPSSSFFSTPNHQF
jgi:hypothetical protein